MPKLKMVKKNGKKVPFYAADGKGKMRAGGSLKNSRRPKSLPKKNIVQKKASGGEILGSLSPLAGIVTGKGLFGKLAKTGLGFGALSAAAALREDAKKKRSGATKAGAKKAGGVVRKKAGGTMKMRGTGRATKGTKFYRNG
jgi:hypothetical protein